MGAAVTPATVTQCSSIGPHCASIVQVEHQVNLPTTGRVAHPPHSWNHTNEIQPRVEEAGPTGKPFTVSLGQAAIGALQGTGHVGQALRWAGVGGLTQNHRYHSEASPIHNAAQDLDHT